MSASNPPANNEFIRWGPGTPPGIRTDDYDYKNDYLASFWGTSILRSPMIDLKQPLELQFQYQINGVFPASLQIYVASPPEALAVEPPWIQAVNKGENRRDVWHDGWLDLSEHTGKKVTIFFVAEVPTTSSRSTSIYFNGGKVYIDELKFVSSTGRKPQPYTKPGEATPYPTPKPTPAPTPVPTPVPPDCWCTGHKNQYMCVEGRTVFTSYCSATQYCRGDRSTPFKKGDWATGCPERR